MAEETEQEFITTYWLTQIKHKYINDELFKQFSKKLSFTKVSLRFMFEKAPSSSEKVPIYECWSMCKFKEDKLWNVEDFKSS